MSHALPTQHIKADYQPADGLQEIYMTVKIASEMHFSAMPLRSLTRPLLDCLLHLTQYNTHMIQALCQALQISVYPWKRVSETHIESSSSQVSF